MNGLTSIRLSTIVLLCLTYGAWAYCSWGQHADREDLLSVIKGRVVDGNTRAAIIAATVTITPVREGATLRTKTDHAGTFEVAVNAPGVYRVSAEAPGFVPGLSLDVAFKQLVKVNNGGSTSNVEVVLHRGATLSGRLIDAETKKAVRGVRIVAFAARWRNGERILMPHGGPLAPSELGEFEVTGLPPGDYFLEVSPAAPVRMHPGGLAVIEEATLGYEYTTLPIGAVDLTVPLTVSGGDRYNLGTVQMRKQRLATATISMISADCVGNAAVARLERRRPGLYTMLGSIDTTCDGTFSLRGLSPGRYYLTGTTADGSLSKRFYGQRVIDVLEPENRAEPMAIRLALFATLSLSGVVQMDREDDVPIPKNLRVMVVPRDGPALADQQAVTVDESGRFTIPSPPRRVRLILAGLPQTSYIKAVTYNGVECAQDDITLTAQSTTQEVNILLSAKPATVGGKVTDGSAPIAGARVLIAPWPFNGKYDDVRKVTTDASGVFEQKGLSPGTYKVLVPHTPTQEALIDEPGGILALGDEAESVIVRQNESRRIVVSVRR